MRGNKLQSDVIIYTSTWCPTTVIINYTPLGCEILHLLAICLWLQKKKHSHAHAHTHTHMRRGGWEGVGPFSVYWSLIQADVCLIDRNKLPQH